MTLVAVIADAIAASEATFHRRRRACSLLVRNTDSINTLLIRTRAGKDMEYLRLDNSKVLAFSVF
jgi:hypothetical protein